MLFPVKAAHCVHQPGDGTGFWMSIAGSGSSTQGVLVILKKLVERTNF